MLNEKKHALYLSYFGVRQPLVHTQVLPYLRELSKIENLKISLLTFEPNFKQNWTPEQIETQKRELAADNIDWYCLPYHKSPSVPATFYDVMNGVRFAVKLSRKQKIDIFHARGHTPAPIGAIAKRICGGKLLFDIRGFMLEEFTDAGVWDEKGATYKAAKRIEKWLMKKSDGFIVLTERAREILFPESIETGADKFGRPVEVIPCCIDEKRFEKAENISREAIRKKMNLENRKVIIYVGTLGGSYMTEDIVKFFKQAYLRNPNSFAVILTQTDSKVVAKLLLDAGLSEDDFLVKSAPQAEVPLYLKAADAAISFIEACYSKQSCSPTKIPEYLAAGLPVIASYGIGDVDAMIEGAKVGVILRDFSDDSYVRALETIDEMLKDSNLREHCRETAYRNFDLKTVGGVRYRNIYKKLLNQ